MIAPAKRMKAMRARRRRDDLRELRLVVPDARSQKVRRRIAEQIARLGSRQEHDAMDWIEGVSEFDEPGTSSQP